jgi:hypothetical protein
MEFVVQYLVLALLWPGSSIDTACVELVRMTKPWFESARLKPLSVCLEPSTEASHLMLLGLSAWLVFCVLMWALRRPGKTKRE